MLRSLYFPPANFRFVGHPDVTAKNRHKFAPAYEAHPYQPAKQPKNSSGAK
jgi:hypothetical protein